MFSPTIIVDVAQHQTLLLAFTIELLVINALYLIMALRWFFILKLMDLTDMVQTKSLQGFTEEELSCDNRVRRFLGKCFPEWQYVKNLWARRAWQRTVKRSILQRRVLQSVSGMFETNSSRTGLDERYSLGTTSMLHNKAESALGLTQWHGHDSEKTWNDLASIDWEGVNLFVEGHGENPVLDPACSGGECTLSF